MNISFFMWPTESSNFLFMISTFCFLGFLNSFVASRFTKLLDFWLVEAYAIFQHAVIVYLNSITSAFFTFPSHLPLHLLHMFYSFVWYIFCNALFFLIPPWAFNPYKAKLGTTDPVQDQVCWLLTYIYICISYSKKFLLPYKLFIFCILHIISYICLY